MASCLVQTAFPIIWIITVTTDPTVPLPLSPGELEDGSLSVRSAGTDEHVSRVLNSGDSAGSQEDLLPGLLQVDDVDPVVLLLEDVLLHRGLAVVRPDVDGSGQHLGDVILLQMRTVRIRKLIAYRL